MNKGVSIIICCYNSSDRLPETIKHIAQQKVPEDINWEILIVDNASTDKTANLASELWAKFDLDIPFHVVSQPIPGLSNAREKGREKSKYEYLLYCDDDNWFDENYVKTSFETMENDHRIGALGGFGTAVSSIDFPEWFSKKQRYYAVGKQADSSGEGLSNRNVLYGAGLTIRRTAYEELISAGFRYLTSGRKKNKLSSGEDSELCLALRLAGWKIWYDENLKFKHFIPANRLDVTYLGRIEIGIKEAGYYTRYYLEYMNGAKPKRVHFFWFIESLQACRNIFKLLFSSSGNKWQDIRNYKALILWLLKENFSYDKNINHLHSLFKELEILRNRKDQDS